jgi:hypothetical protein
MDAHWTHRFPLKCLPSFWYFFIGLFWMNNVNIGPNLSALVDTVFQPNAPTRAETVDSPLNCVDIHQRAGKFYTVVMDMWFVCFATPCAREVPVSWVMMNSLYSRLKYTQSLFRYVFCEGAVKVCRAAREVLRGMWPFAIPFKGSYCMTVHGDEEIVARVQRSLRASVQWVKWSGRECRYS